MTRTPSPYPVPHAPTDADLVARAAAGDERAFRDLVDRHGPAISGTVTRMLGRGPDVDDVVQETFVRFHGALGRFRGDASLSTYLTRIAINESNRLLTRRQRRLGRSAPADDAPEPVAPGHADDWATTETVRRALDGLSPKHRAVVVLRLIEGRSTRETAQALGVPEGTVLSRLSRALSQLEADLRSVLGDHPLT